MAEDQQEYNKVETQQDRGGLFDFMGKKEEDDQVIVVDDDQFNKLKVSEPADQNEDEEKKKPAGLLHRSGSTSSTTSSSSEEGGAVLEEGGERKKKKKEKKGLKEKIEGKFHKEEDTSVPVEKYGETDVIHVEPEEEQKGFLDKIKEKLPGQKKAEDQFPPPPPPAAAAPECDDTVEGGDQLKEKKGILEKIKEKIPGYHTKTEEDHKEKKDEGYSN